MRIALVSPYSWTFPGGVTRHIDELATELFAQGHEVRVLTPVDPDDRLTRALHRRRPEQVELPDYVVPLGRTVSLSANGSVSNLSLFPEGPARLRRALRAGRFDVVHVHEPIAPLVGWDACCFDGAPVVGTFHAYSSKWFPNATATLFGARRIFNKMHARIAVSEAARWTGERYFGGRYEVIPNGVDVAAVPSRPKPASDALTVLFVGRDDERKGLPVLLAAFGGLREHVPVRLRLVGASTSEVEPVIADLNGHTDDVEFLGSLDKCRLWEELHAADVLCAPSLGGESFGMVLIEAFAAGTPVVASDIAGYRQVVDDGVNGILVPQASPLELAEALRSLWLAPERRAAMAIAARERAGDFAWPRVAASVTDVYRRALEAPRPASAPARAAVKLGLRAADLSPRRPPRRLESLDPPTARRSLRERVLGTARKVGLAASALGGVGLCLLALHHVDAQRVVAMLVRSSPSWVLVALALFSASMALRAVSWYSIIRAALPDRPVKRRAVLSGTLVGVLMSATLPGRLGEPSRALIVARKIGRIRETLPVVVGTLLSQTLLNVLALALLAVVVASTSDLFRGHETALALAGVVPVILLAAVVAAPTLIDSSGRFLRRGPVGRAVRAALAALVRLRRGLAVFRRARHAVWAVFGQLSAWALQVLGAFALLVALQLDGRAGIDAAAAVLFAVNVTAVVPVTPSNVGVFQFAVVTVLSGVYGVPPAAALGYGIILQAAEVATAVVFGVPALIGEGLSWRDVRTRALAATPVQLSPADSGLDERALRASDSGR
jgi:phosphatidyl-myo-inositol alpha-mannosyltransferase